MTKKGVLIVITILIAFIFNLTNVNASNSVKVNTTLSRKYGNLYYVNSQGREQQFFAGSYEIDGDDAYCIHPGGSAPKDLTYYEDESFEVLNCSKNFSLECGLAIIITEGISNDYSYHAIETALRLYLAYHQDSLSDVGADGWHDPDTGEQYKVDIYRNTAEAILEWGYNIDNIDDCEELSSGSKCYNLIYSKNTSDEAGKPVNADLKVGFSLFKKVMNDGAKNVWTPEVELVDSQRDSNGDVTFVLQTNFNENTEIEIPESISGYPVTMSKTNCDEGCKLVLTVDVVGPEECIDLNFDITFQDARYTLGMVKRYKPQASKRAQYLMTYDTEPIKEKYHIQYEWCEQPESGSNCCTDMTIKDNMPLTCDESTTGSIEDPQMCTILNACDKNKQKSYDYTSKAGLNSTYCTLYCREEIEFTFMDRTEVIAGRQFKYDVNSRITTTQMLSTVIYGTKQCTSPSINYEKWESDYIAADKAVASAWNNLKKWETLYNHIDEYVVRTDTKYCSDTRCCTGCCSNCLEDGSNAECCGDDYESISCSGAYNIWYWGTNGSGPFYYRSSDANGNERTASATHQSGGASCSNNACTPYCNVVVSYPTDAVIRSNYASAVNAYKSALEKREKLLMDIQNCNLLSYNNFTYKPESYYIGTGQGNYKYSFGESDTSYYKIVNGYNFDSVVEISYDDENSSMVQIESDTPIQHSISQGWCKDCNYDTYCSSCNSSIGISSGLSTKSDLRRLVCTGSEMSADCEIIDTTVPDNHAANLTTSKEQHFWQNTKFYTQLYSGLVSTSPNGQGYWVGLGDYIYPIEINKTNGEYGVYVDLSNLGEATRPDNIKISDKEFICAFEVINELTSYECDPRTDECYIECDPKNEVCDEFNDVNTSLGLVVRSVDLTDLFPTNRAIGMNWADSVKVIDAIESLGNDIYNVKQPQYVIDLSPENIRNIKKYNSYTDYMDYSITCDSSLNCRSSFLTNISTNIDYAYHVDLSVGRNKTTDDYNNYYKYGRD